MTNKHSMKKLVAEIATFVTERDWEQFHSPKNLAMSLAIETAELLEIFQWLTPEQSSSTDHVDLAHLEEEIGDVMIYLATLATKFDLDPVKAAQKKMEINRQKYPADRVKGKADKYDTYR